MLDSSDEEEEEEEEDGATGADVPRVAPAEATQV